MALTMADTCPAVGVATKDCRATCPHCGFSVESRATYSRVPEHETLGHVFVLDPEKVTATPVLGGGVSIGVPAVPAPRSVTVVVDEQGLAHLSGELRKGDVAHIQVAPPASAPRATDVYEKCPACHSIDVRRESRPIPRKVCNSCGASVLLLEALPEGHVFKCCQHGVPATESCAACRADGVTDLDRAHMGFVGTPAAMPTPAAMLGEAVWKAMEAARDAERIAHESGNNMDAALVGDAIAILSGVYASASVLVKMERAAESREGKCPRCPHKAHDGYICTVYMDKTRGTACGCGAQGLAG